MKAAVSITLIIAGTLCVLVPWGYGVWYLHTMATLMTKSGVQSVTIPTLAETSLSGWSQFIGVVMIGAAISGAISAFKKSQAN
jgi:hypothetical protein